MAVDELEIEGFKPLKSLKFEEGDLGMVNVITGRNNTGKSSILEAIDLLYNPSHLDEFSVLAGDIINKDREECSISNRDKKLTLRLPKEKNIPDYYSQAILEMFSDVTLVQERNQGHIEVDIGDIIDQPDDESTYEVISLDEPSSKDAKKVLDLMGKDILVAEIDGDAYPYFHLSRDVFNQFFESTKDIIRKEVLASMGEELGPDIRLDVKYPYPFDEGFFTNEPIDTEQSKIVKTPVADIPDYEPESEEDAIKIDDIEDEITKRGLVDNLKNFDLDYLVFEEDGEKDSVPFDFMGDGFKSMVGVLWEIVDEEYKIVMIEEPENHMHPGYVREMLDFLVTLSREDDIQLFITTHSIDLLNYLFDESLPEEHRSFLEEELSVIRMESPELVEVLDYEEANRKSEELHLDLRGI